MSGSRKHERAGPSTDESRVRSRRSLVLRVGLALALLGMGVEAARLTVFKDSLAQVRADAATAVRQLDSGRLPALEATLAAHRGNADFAYYFTARATPRALGDALATAAGSSTKEPLAHGVDAHAYDLTLADLAGTLALATFGTGPRALPNSWTRDFISATTTPELLYDATDNGDSSDAEPGRVGQDVANKQNLLLLLSRGYWSTPFLTKVTAAYVAYDRDHGNDAWDSASSATPISEGRYAPAANGRYLTDGVLALSAALTTNAAASAWAFRDFQRGEQKIDGSNYKVGKFTHYLLFEHHFPEPTEADSVGMTAALTALSAATTAIHGSPPVSGDEDKDQAGDSGPLHDSLVLRAFAHDLNDSSCSSNFRDYLHCAFAAAEAVWHWVAHWGHEMLDILSLATFAPPPFAVIGSTAAATNATWYAIDGDYGKAGLSLAAALPGLAWTRFSRTAVEESDIANAVQKARDAIGGRVQQELARWGAAKVLTAPKLYRAETELDGAIRSEFPNALIRKTLNPPGCVRNCIGRRVIDVLVPPGKAIELKVGMRNEPFTQDEILRDVKMIADKGNDIRQLEYRFYPDLDGVVGPGPSVRQLLQQYKIPYRVYKPAAA